MRYEFLRRRAVRRILAAYGPEDAPDLESQDRDNLDPREMALLQRVFPPAILVRLRRAFTPRGLEFFQFYVDLRAWAMAKHVPDDAKDQFRRVTARVSQITSPVDGRTLSPIVVNKIAKVRPLVSSLLTRLGNRPESLAAWTQINNLMVPLLQEVAQDKEVWLKALVQGSARWATFRSLSERQVYLKKLEADDPESFALIQRTKETLGEIDDRLRDRIVANGMLAQRGFLGGRVVQLGVDPNTGEKRVFDRDGAILPVEEFLKKRQDQDEARKRAALIAERTTGVLDDVKTIPQSFLTDTEGAIEWHALTDDQAKTNGLTRLLPTKTLWETSMGPDGTPVQTGRAVVIDGRYKGAFLDDLVNGVGRLVEGTSFSYSPRTGRGTGAPVRIDPSQREPYVSVTTVAMRVGGRVRKVKKLYLKIPGTREYKELRGAVKSLAGNFGTRGSVPSIVYRPVEGSLAAGFEFEPKDFGLVRDTLRGISMSAEALRLLQAYYQDLSRAEQATAAENLGHYAAQEIGGFVTSKKDRSTGEMVPFDFSVQQKQALAWLDANGNRGVCGLDTGMGKTLVTTAMMQKLVRDGLADEGASYTDARGRDVKTNGRFLYVCPKALKGNLGKEIAAFVSDAGSLRDRVDVISYREFASASKSGKKPRSIARSPAWRDVDTWDPGTYVSIFFDEAQEMKNASSGVAKAALSVWHPRKICLTASPMEHSPMEAYVLSAIANNLPLKGPEGRANRAEMKRFKERFCEVLGGRIVGAKADPGTMRDMMTWVKRNIFYADKRSSGGVLTPEEFEALKTAPPEEAAKLLAGKLPPLASHSVAVTMPPEAEAVYAGVAKQFARVMGGLVAKFKEKGGVGANDPAVEQAFGLRFAPVLNLMNSLANYPEVALKDIASMIQTNAMPDGRPVPDVLTPLVTMWRRSLQPDDLIAQASQMANPKLAQAQDIIAQGLAQTEGSARALLFTDDPRFCKMAGKYLSSRTGEFHCVALSDAIGIFQGGQPLPEWRHPIDQDVLRALVKDPAEQDRLLRENDGYAVLNLPFRARAYRRFPTLPAHPRMNPHYKTGDWQTFVFREIVTPTPRIKTCILHGQTYQYGQNLQAFDTVIHLDRDTWNAQDMAQRTARAWRQGQQNAVDEYVVDATYSPDKDGEPRPDSDQTLDQIRGYFQQMEGDLFESIIRAAQATQLGREWLEMKKRDASNMRLDRGLAEAMLSPFASRSRPVGE